MERIADTLTEIQKSESFFIMLNGEESDSRNNNQMNHHSFGRTQRIIEPPPFLMNQPMGFYGLMPGQGPPPGFMRYPNMHLPMPFYPPPHLLMNNNFIQDTNDSRILKNKFGPEPKDQKDE